MGCLEKQAKTEAIVSAPVISSLILKDGVVGCYSTASSQLRNPSHMHQALPPAQSSTVFLSSDATSARKKSFENRCLKVKRGKKNASHLVQSPCRSTVTYSRLHRTSSRWVLDISREGDSTTPPENLFQGSVTLRGKKFFLTFRWNFLRFSLCLLPLVLKGTSNVSKMVMLRFVLVQQKPSHPPPATNYRQKSAVLPV